MTAGDPPRQSEEPHSDTVAGAAPPAFGAAWGGNQEEVRLAMGWNGGVSLAIWMGGVAVELDQGRRTIPRKPSASSCSTAALYQALADAFDRRLVIDILAGASAGGLNGALLAGVITHGKELSVDTLRQRWLDIGDFGTLMKSLDEAKPTSLMQGKLFLDKLTEAFQALLKSDQAPKPDPADAPLPVLLDVQVTNVIGHEREFVDDWGLPFRALEHRAPVQFRRWEDFNVETLATAARASASFPGAFEPVKISDTQTGSLVVPRTTWAIDGGLLENAPIRQAIELIPQRPASGPVKRYVCYVNAAPTGPQELEERGEPDLRQVISYAINLPRNGRVVDQLYALEDATRRAGVTSTVGLDLLSLDIRQLLQMAGALLRCYQRRRGALSLEELMSLRGGGGPGRAQRTLEALAADLGAPEDLPQAAAELPWIPRTVDDIASAGAKDGTWRFGIRAAQRVVQLELDVLRTELVVTDSADVAAKIFERRIDLDDAITKLEAQRLSFLARDGTPASQVENLARGDAKLRRRALAALQPTAEENGREALDWLRRATVAFYRLLEDVAPDTAAALFAPFPDVEPPDVSEEQGNSTAPADELPPEAFRGFLARALAVEVIRRSFSDDFDIESAQRLHVAQLTPLTESPLFDRGYGDGPRHRPPGAAPVAPKADADLGPSATREKLCGVRLGHFAGFYRRSWRANDFMWGRLDGAAMIARLLIDSERAKARLEVARDGEKPWQVLAKALLATDANEQANADRRALLEEHLGGDVDASRLQSALEVDLRQGEGELTRSLIARALQYQILREELPFLADAAAKDREVGASPSPVRNWSASGSLNDTIGALRKGRGASSLPGLLGADDRDEATSQLALRTLSRALLVATAALGGAVPMGRLLQPARVPLLSIQGSTAKRPLDRIATAVAVSGAAWYVLARLLAIIEGVHDPSRPSAGGKVPINALWTAPVLAYLVSVLAVVGFAAVPILRAIRSRRWRRLFHGAFALALLACGGLVLFVEAVRAAGFSQAITTWSAPDFAPKATLALVTTVGVIQAASISSWLVRGVAFGQRMLKTWIAATSAIYAVIAIVLAVYAAKHGLPHTWPTDTWRRIAVVSAIAVPVLALGYVRAWAGWNRRGD